MTFVPPPPQGQPLAPAGSWTFWADASVPPHAPFGQMQVIGFTCGWVLSDFGAGEATIPVDRNALTREQLLQFWSWRFWAYYNGQPVWGGLPIAITDTGDAAVKVALMELPGYLNRKAYATSHTYTGVEQTVIAADLAARLANISVPVVTNAGPGRNRDRKYQFLDGDSRGALLLALTQVSNGPQFRSEYSLDGSNLPVCTFRIAYPRVGVAGKDSGLALTVPGGAVSFSLEWDAENLRTRTFAVGDIPDDAVAGSLKPVVQVVGGPAGVPMLDAVDDHQGVYLTSTLQEKGDTAALIQGEPQLTLSAVLPVNAPPLDSYGVGDDVNVDLMDPMLPAGFTTTGTLTKIDADSAAGTVAWEVAAALPHPKRRTLHNTILVSQAKIKQAHHHNLQVPGGITET